MRRRPSALLSASPSTKSKHPTDLAHLRLT
jgi:hypothetical protein